MKGVRILKRYRFEQFSATRLFYPAVGYSPDGTQIAHITNTTGQYNLWTVPSGGGFSRQITSYTDNTVRAFSWSPDGTQILFQADQNGDEQHQIYLVGAGGGWPEALTSNLEVQHNLGGDAWTPDGKTIAYCANDQNPANMNVITRDMATGELHRVVESDGLFFPAGWSPDGRYLILADFRSNTDQHILLLDLETNQITNTTPHEGEIIYASGPWAADSSGFYLVTNEGKEFQGLAFYSIADGKWEWIDTPEHDVEFVAVSKNGRALVWGINVGGASQLRGRDLQTGQALKLPELPLGVIGAMDISPDGKRLALLFARPIEAANLYEVDLETGEMTALSQSMLGGVDPADMVEPELIEYPTFDGRKIPAWLFRPKGNAEQYPVVVSIHGGPEAQERPTYIYNGLYQYLLNRGFGVLAPNIRGSTGYGITYQKLIHRDWGGAELKDIEGAAKYLQSLDWVDKNRIAVFGGSFGGFATLSALTRLPDYWALGVDVVGPSNLLTFVNSVPPFWKRFMKQWVGDAVEDRDLLIERSPITYVDNVRVPMLVIQGAKDPRVVKAESDQMVERIRKRGGDIRYYVDEEEGHGATRRANQLKWWKMVADYMEEYLLDEPA
jgi:dipeptidyl aminopeptidase/acylaminoacyl peptidase